MSFWGIKKVIWMSIQGFLKWYISSKQSIKISFHQITKKYCPTTFTYSGIRTIFQFTLVVSVMHTVSVLCTELSRSRPLKLLPPPKHNGGKVLKISTWNSKLVSLFPHLLWTNHTHRATNRTMISDRQAFGMFFSALNTHSPLLYTDGGGNLTQASTNLNTRNRNRAHD